VPVEKARRSALTHVVRTFFDGSPSQLMATLLDSPSSKLADEEFERLERLIRDAKGKRK
jgi:hypothetical protein